MWLWLRVRVRSYYFIIINGHLASKCFAIYDNEGIYGPLINRKMTYTRTNQRALTQISFVIDLKIENVTGLPARHINERSKSVFCYFI